MEELATQAFWLGLAKIIGVNIVLSGDNAVVIALAARSLPPRQQKQAWLKIVGSLLLFWIGIKLLVPEDDGDDITASDHLLTAIKTILIADLVMSLDNVIAVAAAASGSMTLLILGLAISIPLVVFGATLLVKAMERYPVIITVGAGLIGWVAGEMVITDLALQPWLEPLGAVYRGDDTGLRPYLGGVNLEFITGAIGVVIVVAWGMWLAKRHAIGKQAPAGPGPGNS
jgi:predicted tellurium resistance membrane protein TerC